MTETVISSVMVYRRGALVTRKGSVELVAGKNTVFITGASQSADEDSIRLYFGSNVKAADVNIIRGAELSDNEDVRAAELEKQIAAVGYELEICKEMAEIRKHNADFTSHSEGYSEAQEKYLAELPDHLITLYNKTKELEERRKSLDMELALNQAARKDIVVKAELVAAADGLYPFELKYLEHASGWSPLYEFRYSSENDPLRVVMRARITQQTREDWKNVSVAMYTGNPSASHELPEVRLHRVSIFEEVFRKNSLAKGRMCAEGAAPVAYEECCEEEPEFLDAVLMDEAEVSSEETMTAYELPGGKDILAGKDGNMADLKTFEVPAKYRILAVPAVDDRCFMSACIRTDDWPMPAASAKIYIRDAYAGEVTIEPDTEEDEFELSLGTDERVSISRKDSPAKTSEAFLKGSKRRKHEYTIKCRNNSAVQLKILIKDSIPVSEMKSVTVENVELAGGSLDEKTGELKWEKTLEPSASEELQVTYDICWPKDKRLREWEV